MWPESGDDSGGGRRCENDAQLRAEIKQLLKEAAALSEPSTFAQSAKLRRMAAAKERELAKSQESASKEIKTSVNLFEKALMISKILTYLICIVCFWRSPVAAISKELVQPFGTYNQNMRCKAQASSAQGSWQSGIGIHTAHVYCLVVPLTLKG
ncbi:hypothetical protein E3N88_29867 [Mikania micrantha]|uniref:Uncharacterized protein n=1 Tax=Mikania micrantha TaxID=192012 RepID=A0A5N6MMW5_9ASTR|nr:hypothetical protein E3N88_29867 [Mikania micrantha]